jgi:alkaline phosphatase
MKVSRRSVLGSGVLGLGALPTLLSAKPAGVPQLTKEKPPKNIIFMVADGMADQVPAMATQFRMLTEGKPSTWQELMGQDYAVNGLQDTASLNSLVTDSAAASTSWGSGRRIWNGMLNMYPDGTKLKTLVQIMSENKVRCGLVTTTRITHATPAGFAVNNLVRDNEDEIAADYMRSGVEVLMGGGNAFFSPDKRKDKRNLYAEYATAGFHVVRDKTAMDAWDGQGKFLGIYADQHIPYTIDRRNDPALDAVVPTLAAMTKKAIEALKGSSNGFLLQVEGGKVDHGGHANDLAGMLYDQMEFEDAVRVAVEFALADGETLVVITADHATGGPSLNGAGDEYSDSTAGLLTVQNMKCSYEVLSAHAKDAKTAADFQDLVLENLGLKLTTEEADAIVATKAGKSPFALNPFQRGLTSVMGVVFGNYSKVQWTSGNHTSEWVLVTAVGPQSSWFHGVHRNQTFFDMMLATKGLQHENPTMDLATAKPLYEEMQKRLKTGGLLMTRHADQFNYGA